VFPEGGFGAGGSFNGSRLQQRKVNGYVRFREHLCVGVYVCVFKSQGTESADLQSFRWSIQTFQLGRCANNARPGMEFVLSRNCGSPHAAQGLRPGSGCLDLDAQSRRCSLDSVDNY
jgi:hypothetical protein